MGQPAARLTDLTSHGGLITAPGALSVVIEGQPAARVTDMHVCPAFTATVPHVGGPIVGPGSATVIIEGRPAARVGDMATCAGGPASIMKGAKTVLIG